VSTKTARGSIEQGVVVRRGLAVGGPADRWSPIERVVLEAHIRLDRVIDRDGGKVEPMALDSEILV
jgi:hypothetical protein